MAFTLGIKTIQHKGPLSDTAGERVTHTYTELPRHRLGEQWTTNQSVKPPRRGSLTWAVPTTAREVSKLKVNGGNQAFKVPRCAGFTDAWISEVDLDTQSKDRMLYQKKRERSVHPFGNTLRFRLQSSVMKHATLGINGNRWLQSVFAIAPSCCQLWLSLTSIACHTSSCSSHPTFGTEDSNFDSKMLQSKCTPLWRISEQSTF